MRRRRLDRSNGQQRRSSPAPSGGTLNYYIYAPVRAHRPPAQLPRRRDDELQPDGLPLARRVPDLHGPAARTSRSPTWPPTPAPRRKGGKVWKFTLKDGPKWEDGKPVTCEDFKYGASRVFATDVITGGPNYLLTYLDVPTDAKTGLPAYDGPYKGDGQALFDKAITCDGNTITYNFKKPWPDFPLAVASLHMMDPYRQDKDQGAKSNYQIFSNGPYKIEGSMWNKNKGAVFVRNTNYDPKTDSTDIRKALPDEIIFQVGQTTETIYDRLIADNGADQTAVTAAARPPGLLLADRGCRQGPLRAGEVALRRLPDAELPPPEGPQGPRGPQGRDRRHRLDQRRRWVKAYSPAESIVNPAVIGYQANPTFSGPQQGDPAAAKKMLEDAGRQAPVPDQLHLPESDADRDKQAAALKQTLGQGRLQDHARPLGDTYYDVIQKPTKTATSSGAAGVPTGPPPSP